MVRLAFKTSQVLVDLLVLALALWIAFQVRFDWEVPPHMYRRLLFVLPYVVGLQYLTLTAYGVPRFAWRYVGLREVVRVLQASGTSFALLLAGRLVLAALAGSSGFAQYALAPIGVLLIDFGLVFLGVSGVRVVRRLQTEQRASRQRAQSRGPRVRSLLVGAGQAGLMVAKEIANRPDLNLVAVGFVDDDPDKVGKVVHGLKVLGTTAELREVLQRTGARQVLITIANAPGREIRRLQTLCAQAGLPVKIIPGVYEIVGGQVNLTRLRDVSIEDLLRREAVTLETGAISEALRGKVVLVTGAGGSIGSELCRQICRFAPSRLILLEQAENSLFHIHRELIATFPELAGALAPCIADICSQDRIEAVFAAHRPDVVFHAAAHKHVPMMEWNPGEAVRNNVMGSRILADAAHVHRVQKFVMISTDKAVNPTSVMGASKRTAEIYIQALGQRSDTRFVTVRFGNVLGSAGSVIPIFKEQIARGGPVLVTHPEMKRYFMTIPEACQLVLQAGTMGAGGEIFLLDMGEPVKIVDLARDLITLSGLRPDEDIEIRFTGMRPGEKLFEELSVAEEAVDKTRHPKVFVGRVRPNHWEDVVGGLARLEAVINERDASVIRAQLQVLVPEYTPYVPEAPAPRPVEDAQPAAGVVALKPAVAGV